MLDPQPVRGVAEALKAFTDRHGLARGAIVAILSDGWERGDPDDLAREMQRLARLAHKIRWVNRRAGAPGYEAVTAGMAALPHIDALIPGDDPAAVITALRSAP